jgi:hypothetical protein
MTALQMNAVVQQLLYFWLPVAVICVAVLALAYLAITPMPPDDDEDEQHEVPDEENDRKPSA